MTSYLPQTVSKNQINIWVFGRAWAKLTWFRKKIRMFLLGKLRKQWLYLSIKYPLGYIPWKNNFKIMNGYCAVLGFMNVSFLLLGRVGIIHEFLNTSIFGKTKMAFYDFIICCNRACETPRFLIPGYMLISGFLRK